jgi:hypothetical protein
MKKILLAPLLLVYGVVVAQNLPSEMQISPDGRMLLLGKKANTGLYDSAIIRSIYLDFPQTNYWSLLTSNYASHTDILAKMTVDNVVYDSVGVRFKGQTSYSMSGNSQKKSFNITTDYVKDGQDLLGYETLNLNNSFQDASFLREVFYLHQIKRHIPAAKANYVQLYLNNQNWGLYPNVQQLNKTYLKEWFFNNNGTLWRADRPNGTTGGGPGGGGPGWGDGTAALNYLGTDTATYKQYYTLKSTQSATPWDILVDVTDALNNTPSAQLTEVLPDYMDVDRVLWHLASEIAFTDDDSYVYKGKMDYYCYQDAVSGLMTTLEYDGNSSMETNLISSWGPFYNANKVNYPLLNKILAIPEWRQRYLAHLRTIIAEEMNPAVCHAMLDNFKAMIDPLVQADPKKATTYAAFGTEVTVLKNFITNRVNALNNNAEVAQVAPVINSVDLYNSQNTAWVQPVNDEVPYVTANVSSTNGISKVMLYHTAGLAGNFDKTEMLDDGLHHDGTAGDGVYGADLPAQAFGTWVRFYVEAAANNTAKSVSYLPTGAEHDVFVYQVTNQTVEGKIVINEVVAVNNNGAVDEQGTNEDWIELYNKTTDAVDISGYFLSDNAANLAKFEIPEGTIIPANGYLIFWADEDGSDGPNHCNFKLSASGETVYLLNPDQQIIDQTNFGQQEADLAWARVPNGSGPFQLQAPTFNDNNENISGTDDIATATPAFYLAPNPAQTQVLIRIQDFTNNNQLIEIFDVLGRNKQVIQPQSAFTSVSISDWAPGVYWVNYAGKTEKLVVGF